jgi:hypothetical protein
MNLSKLKNDFVCGLLACGETFLYIAIVMGADGVSR